MKLCRSQSDRQVAGVCGGLAKHFDVSSSKLRVIWVLGTLFSAAFPGFFISAALVSAAGRTATRAGVRPAAVAAVEEGDLKVMAENQSNEACPKCGNAMQEGYVPDRGYHDNQGVFPVWVFGKPEKRFLGDIDLEGKIFLNIVTFRCSGCGFLESFAQG